MLQQDFVATQALRNLIWLIVLFALMILPDVAASENADKAGAWGDLRIRFSYDGMDLPKLEPLTISSDVEVMKKFDVVDERWVVDPKTLALANVIIYIEEKDAPVHESYDKDAAATIPLTFRRGRLDPHVVCVRTSQTLAIKNDDPVAYAAKSELLMNQPFLVLLPRGQAITHQFKHAEKFPTPVTDAIHPWVRGWLFVRQSPYVGCSSKDGLLEMNNIPAGTWTFRFWHEEIGFLSGLGKKGQLRIEIKPDETRELVVRLRKDNKGVLIKSTSRPSN